MTEDASAHPYSTLAYARTLAHVGVPTFVPQWGTYVLARNVDDTGLDAVGPYPLTVLSANAEVQSGLQYLLDAGMVSVTLVCDHLSGPPAAELSPYFDVSRAFKPHYIVDRVDAVYAPIPHHRDRIARARRRGVRVDWVRLQDHLSRWVELYDELIVRHAIAGAPKFTRSSFTQLAQCSGLCTAAAFMDDVIVGFHLWFRHETTVWSHLAAVGEHGRKNGAAFALYDYSIAAFTGCVISLGGAAGVAPGAADGLAEFKSGFASGSVASVLYGSALDRVRYAALCARAGVVNTRYFPAYRSTVT